MNDKTAALAAPKATMTDAEIFELFRKNCVDYPGNYEVTPGQALRIARAIESRAAAPQQEPVGKVLSEDEMGAGYDHRMGNVLWWNKPKGPAMLYAAPIAAQPQYLQGYDDALSHAAMYVRDHCKSGEEHAEAIYGMKRPTGQPAAAPVGEIVMFGTDCKEVSWSKGRMPPPGTKLYAAPQQAIEAAVPDIAREARNRMCIDGHLNNALDDMIGTNSPDGMFSILGALADKAIDITLSLAAPPQPQEPAAVPDEREAAHYKQQRDRLLDFIKHAPVSSGVCCCGDAMDKHPEPMVCGHSPVDEWDHAVRGIVRDIEESDSILASAPAQPTVPEQIDELGKEIARLQNALAFWLPNVPAQGSAPQEVIDRISNDAFLLIGADGNLPDQKSAEELGWLSLSTASQEPLGWNRGGVVIWNGFAGLNYSGPVFAAPASVKEFVADLKWRLSLSMCDESRIGADEFMHELNSIAPSDLPHKGTSHE